MFRLCISAGLLLSVLLLAGCSLKPPSVTPTPEDYLKAIPQSAGLPAADANMITPPQDQVEAGDSSQATQAVFKTNLGDITVVFYPESPKTVANFVRLAKAGFYDGVRFHRVIKGFMLQSGDPNSKDDDWSNDGTGGPGYTFPDEFNQHKLVRGSLAMANAGPDTNGSQFFIVTAAATPWLDGKHTNFGYVAAGLDVVDKIEATATNQNDHPLQDVTINQIVIE